MTVIINWIIYDFRFFLIVCYYLENQLVKNGNGFPPDIEIQGSKFCLSQCSKS